MNALLIQRIRVRAQNRCEYCGILCSDYRLPFQIDHIIARQHGGTSDEDNLALSCLHCNRHKGPNIAGRDTATGEVVRLFHPRTDLWSEHFRLERSVVIGLTPVGRSTVQVLAMNEPQFLAIREALILERGWPPLT